MIREDRKLELVRLPVTLPRLFMGRWTLQSGNRGFPERWRDEQVATWRNDQQYQPVCLTRDKRRALWWFQDRCYWEDGGLTAHDVQALVLRLTLRAERQLTPAHALMRGERSGERPRIPAALVRAVIARDGRKCVDCGASDDLQIDHIVPVALGGGSSVENLQVLCGSCNRAKGDCL